MIKQAEKIALEFAETQPGMTVWQFTATINAILDELNDEDTLEETN